MRHDDHYAALPIQPCAVMDQRMDPHPDVPPRVQMRLAVAIQYLMRAGLKAGEPWEKDVTKAIAHLTYALKGEWS